MPQDSIGALLDRYFSVRRRRLDTEKRVETLKKSEAEHLHAAVAAMNEAHTDLARCKRGTLSLKLVSVHKVTDWDRFWSFVHRQKAAHLLQKRLHESNLEEFLLQHRRVNLEAAGVETVQIQKATATSAR